MGFPESSVGKESACNAGDPSSIPGSGRSPRETIGYPLKYSWASRVAHLKKLCLQYGTPGFDPWVGKIPWRRERLPTPVFWPGEFHGLYGVAKSRTRLSDFTFTLLFTFMHWRRKWQPTPVILLGESQGRWSLVGCSLWGAQSQT